MVIENKVRQMAGVLLRRLTFTQSNEHSSGLWGSASLEVQQVVQAELLQAIKEEKTVCL